MEKYIDSVIQISGPEKYEKEFKFITKMKLNEFFSSAEFDKYLTIKSFYHLRDLLIHGSVTKSIMIVQENGGKIEMDTDDSTYQNMVLILHQYLKIDIPGNLFSIDLMLVNNEVANMIVNAVIIVSKKFLEKNIRAFQFIKQNVFEKNT